MIHFSLFHHCTRTDAPLSPGSNYNSQSIPQYNTYDSSSPYSTTPKGFGTGIAYNNTNNYSTSNNYNNNNNAIPSYATTPRKYATQIQIQTQAPRQYGGSLNNSFDQDGTDAYSFPDYTIPYKQQEPIHDAPGGPVNLGRSPQSQPVNSSYSSRSLPRAPDNYSSSYNGGYDEDPYNTAPDPNLFSPRFNTGMPYQPQPQQQQQQQQFSNVQKPPHGGINSPRSYEGMQNNSPSQVTSYSPGQFSPSPGYNVRSATPSSGYASQQQQNSAPFSPASYYNNTPSSSQANVHGSGANTYSTLPISKPSYTHNRSDNSPSTYHNNVGSPQHYSTPKTYTPTPVSYNASPTPFSPAAAQSSYNASPTPYTPTPVQSSYNASPTPYTPTPVQSSYNASPTPYTPTAAQSSYNASPTPYTPTAAQSSYNDGADTVLTHTGYTCSLPMRVQPLSLQHNRPSLLTTNPAPNPTRILCLQHRHPAGTQLALDTPLHSLVGSASTKMFRTTAR